MPADSPPSALHALLFFTKCIVADASCLAKMSKFTIRLYLYSKYWSLVSANAAVICTLTAAARALGVNTFKLSSIWPLLHVASCPPKSSCTRTMCRTMSCTQPVFIAMTSSFVHVHVFCFAEHNRKAFLGLVQQIVSAEPTP